MRSLIGIVAVGCVVAGCSAQSPLTPSALGGSVGGPLAASAGSDTTTVHRFSDGTAVAGASSTLVRTDNGVSMTLHTLELQSGAAYTVWWIVFNHPDQCATSPCGEPDLFDPDVATLVTHAAGHVISPNGTGHFGGALREGAVVDNLLGGVGALLDARAAEIHFVVRTHGVPRPGDIPDQIHTFELTCSPGVCEDVQFAIHQP